MNGEIMIPSNDGMGGPTAQNTTNQFNIIKADVMTIKIELLFKDLSI